MFCITKFTMFTIFTYLGSTLMVSSYGSLSFALSEKHDPGFLIVSPAYPDLCFTVFDADIKNKSTYAVNMMRASLSTLEYQIFHSYYRVVDRGVWFEWVRKLDKNGDNMYGYGDDSGVERIQVIASGLEIHGTKKLIESDQLFKIASIRNSNFFRIMSNGKCLTVADYKNVERDAYPLFFRPCVDSIEQEFTFVSILKSVCLMGSKNYCPKNDPGSIDIAERNVHERIAKMKY